MQQIPLFTPRQNCKNVHPPDPPAEAKISRLTGKRKSGDNAVMSVKQLNKLPSYLCIYKVLIFIILVGGRIKKIILPDLTGSYRRKLKIILPEI